MFKLYLILIIIVEFIFPQISDGCYLFSPIISLPEEDEIFQTILIDTSGNILHEWSHECSVASTPYLLPDSTLLRPCKLTPPLFDVGGAGGLIQLISWGNEVIWEFQLMNNEESQHHDIEYLPNGNILLISWDMKSQADALLAGKLSHTGDLWSEKIIEITPILPDSAIVVWEWHLWDHLIQDNDSTLDNYGILSQHPELLDINFALTSNEGPLPPQFTNPDMIHLNAIDYNQTLDQIVISSRKTNEIYIIDHSTSSAEAASHNGGNSGVGGDLLYRWGNSSIYDRGSITDKILYAPHSVNWIEDDGLIVFNNGVNRPSGDYSSVEIIILPIIETGSYEIFYNEPYMPQFPNNSYNINENYFTQSQGGAFQLNNGNILITISNMKIILEIDATGEILWQYYYNGNGNLSRAQKYEFNYFTAPIDGDINSDLLVNILDVIICVNMILDLIPPLEIADINQDGAVDILDVVILVNIILN